MKKQFPFGSPEELERKRALDYMALTPTEKYERPMKLIKINYDMSISIKDLRRPAIQPFTLCNTVKFHSHLALQ